MRIVRLIISIFLISIIGCTSIRSSEEISLEKTENSKLVKINYDNNRYNSVKLDNIIIDSGRNYYIQEGKYVLSYIEETTLNGYVGFSWRKSKEGSSDKDRKIPIRKVVNIKEDMEINLENHSVQINFLGIINSNKKF